MEQPALSPFLNSRGIVCADTTFLEDPEVVAQSISRLKAPHRRGRPGGTSFGFTDISLSASCMSLRMPAPMKIVRSSSMDLDCDQ
jgi:hypothetical protein